jgi:hypothetical protein
MEAVTLQAANKLMNNYCQSLLDRGKRLANFSDKLELASVIQQWHLRLSGSKPCQCKQRTSQGLELVPGS